MKRLTAEEKEYLRKVYESGGRYVTTDMHNSTAYFFKAKPMKGKACWLFAFKISSLSNFGTSWSDEEPTKILDLLESNEEG